jgi:hypothetical protein
MPTILSTWILLLLVCASAPPASAFPAPAPGMQVPDLAIEAQFGRRCWKCCGGQFPEGGCSSMCSTECPRPPERIRPLRHKDQCAPDYQLLSCSGPRCTFVCRT